MWTNYWKSLSVITEFKYKRFFDLSTDMLCIANKDGYFVRVNESFSKVLGYSTEYLLAHPIVNFLHPSDVSTTLEKIEDGKKGRNVSNFINRYKNSEGNYLTFSWNSQTDPDNNLIYAVARDVTEQRNQTNILKQIQQTLDKESIIAITDKRGIITEVNERFCDISGYTREELLGKTHNIVSSHTHSKDFFKELWKTISSKNIWADVIKNKKKNGDYYYVHTIITPLLDHENNIFAYLSIRQDISESVKTELYLAKIITILNETSASAKVGGWELNVSTGELTWTDETFRILGVEKTEGQQPMLPEGLSLFTPHGQTIIEDAINLALTLGEPYSLEVQAKTVDGRVFWVYTNGKPNFKDGKIVSLSGTIQDIDSRKKAELSYNLERQKSIQSAKLASIGELAASMAHEINNPLGIISGYTELMLQSSDLSEKTISKLDIVLKSCGRISHIVNRLRKFSRTEKTTEYIEKPLSLIVQEASSLAQPRLKREFVEFEFIGNEHVLINCCEIEIEQVILNLINNSIDAVKSLKDKWIKLSILEKNDFAELWVIDSGTGISEAIQDKIFSPFFTTKKAGEGTGLGLSIISSILEDHSAYIKYVESENTSFVITFPIVKRSNHDL